MELSEREAHCIARLLQGAWYGNDDFDGCNFCKYPCLETKDIGNGHCYGFYPVRSALMTRLTEETGVDLSPTTYGKLWGSDFPYLKFLKNANEPTKAYFRDAFKDV